MWKEPPNLESTPGKIREAVRVFLGVLTSPLLIVWALVSRKPRLLPLGLAYLFGPLAIVWVLVTRRELELQIGSVQFRIEPHYTSDHIRSGGLIYAVSNGTKMSKIGRVVKGLPFWRFGPLEFSLRDQFTISSDRLITKGGVTVKLFARGDARSYRHGVYPGDVSSVPIGPAEIQITRFNPARAGDELPYAPPRLPDLAEVVSMAKMPVYGLESASFGLAAVLYAATNQGPGQHEAHGVTIHFEDHPSVDEDPERSAGKVQAYLRKRDEEEMRRLVRSYKLPARWLAPYENPTVANGLPSWPPLPTKVLHLDSSDNYPERSPEQEVELDFQEMEDKFLEHRFEHDPAALTLFAGLPGQVRGQLSDLQAKQFCLRVGEIAWRCVPDLLTEIATSGAQVIARRFVIDGNEFDGQLLYWPHRYPLCSFRLEHQAGPNLAYRLEGATYGITLEQVEELLEGLVTVNDRPDLIAQYQAEHDEHRRKNDQWLADYSQSNTGEQT
jgi:hypothetical protein